MGGKGGIEEIAFLLKKKKVFGLVSTGLIDFLEPLKGDVL